MLVEYIYIYIYIFIYLFVYLFIYIGAAGSLCGLRLAELPSYEQLPGSVLS